jgi:pimeloyl-[acyl-carrier protein] methyl ester esterase
MAPSTLKIVSSKGQGPILNVLHGWGMNAHLFDDWSDQLALYFQVNLIDLPGHGLNHEEILNLDLNALAEEASHIPKGIWLGWSMGGLLALNLALKKPQQVDTLIMLCATPCFVAGEHWPHGTQSDVLTQFAKNLQLDIKQTIQTFLALEVMGVDDERSQLKVLKQKVFERPLPSEQALSAGLQLLKQVDLSAELKNLTPRSLWISGRRDRLVLPAAMQQAAALCGGEYHMLRGSGHAPFIRQAADLTPLIRNFIKNLI